MWLIWFIYATNAQAQVRACKVDPDCMAAVTQALSFSTEQHYSEALSIYEEAFAKSADPGLLPNIGRMQQKLGKFELAIATYRLSLSLPLLAHSKEERRKTQEWLDETLRQQKLQFSLSAPILPHGNTTENLSHSGLNITTKPRRSPWFWTGVGLTVAATAAVAIGTAIGIWGRLSCTKENHCYRF